SNWYYRPDPSAMVFTRAKLQAALMANQLYWPFPREAFKATDYLPLYDDRTGTTIDRDDERVAWLANKILVVVGDSLDMHLVQALCFQQGLAIQGVPGISRVFMYQPAFCTNPRTNMTVVRMMSYGVLHPMYPAQHTDGESTREVISRLVPKTLRALG